MGTYMFDHHARLNDSKAKIQCAELFSSDHTRFTKRPQVNKCNREPSGHTEIHGYMSGCKQLGWHIELAKAKLKF